jgi:hydroxyethylthiazole kinase-like uncharacterized protein yjeF
MIPLLSADEMRRLDRATIDELGVPVLVLMETAGRAVADVTESLVESLGVASTALLLCGPGNNGGDAVVAARHLSNRGFQVTLALVGGSKRRSADLVRQLEIAERLDLPLVELEGTGQRHALAGLLAEHAVVVDGLFGTGLARPLDARTASIVEMINAAERPVVSIDLPSGIDADTGRILGAAVRATRTVTFCLPKIGHLMHPGRACTGTLETVDIGIPYSLVEELDPKATLIGPQTLALAVPPRDADAHKGSFGHALVVAGVPERPGAALLAARAALRTGAGLVTLGTDAETLRRLAPALTSVMGAELGADDLDAARLTAALERKTAVAVGPSLAPSPALAALLREVFAGSRLPLVLDAGALDAVADDPSWLRDRPAPTILTPHPGEMGRLMKLDTAAVQADRLRAARSLAAGTGAHVVLKGASTVVADPDGKVGVISAGNPGMATAGAGDVLTGVIVSLLAQGVDAPLAARAGAQLHALAGDRAAALGGVTRLIADDLLDHLAFEAEAEEGEA